MSVDANTKQIEVKFGGAYSGNYKLQVTSKDLGRLNCDSLHLIVQTKVTSVSPKSGSIYGGTLLTITGENFSDDPLDNPVKVGDVYCLVLTSTPTEITCRIANTIQQKQNNIPVLVFTKTSEEAVCDPINTCKFSYTEPTHTVSQIESVFDDKKLETQIVVSGSGF